VYKYEVTRVKTPQGFSKANIGLSQQESRAVAGNPRDAAVIFDP